VPLYNVAEVLDDPQVKHLGLIEELEHPKAGKLKFVGAPVRFDNLVKEKSAPPPLVGEQSGKVLGELGYSDDAFNALQAQGVTQSAR
jgi:crotonobetainyl-CoA:carnitine CoA-transferase CaiB-like acyl-CoA transferase